MNGIIGRYEVSVYHTPFCLVMHITMCVKTEVCMAHVLLVCIIIWTDKFVSLYTSHVWHAQFSFYSVLQCSVILIISQSRTVIIMSFMITSLSTFQKRTSLLAYLVS